LVYFEENMLVWYDFFLEVWYRLHLNFTSNMVSEPS